jgi:hypothetical protein
MAHTKFEQHEWQVVDVIGPEDASCGPAIMSTDDEDDEN